MKTIIFALLMSVALGTKTVFFRTSKAHDPKTVDQDEDLFKNQFNEKFRSREAVKVTAFLVTASTLKNYEPLPKETKVENINNYLQKLFPVEKALELMITRITDTGKSKETLSHEVVPVFKVEYEGSDLNEEDRAVNVEIEHKNLIYEVAQCRICFDDCSQDPKIICINNHSFCKSCLNKLEKAEGINTCPLCRSSQDGSTLTPELQTHLHNSGKTFEALGLAVIYLIFTAFLYVPYLVYDSKSIGASISNASGFAFQIYAGVFASYSVLPLYRQFRGQLVRSALSTSTEGWKTMAVVLVTFISNLVFGVFTIGGWATFFGVILLFPLVVLLNIKFN